MIFFVLLLNFAISCFNAWSCGKSAAETKAAGGLPRFMWWMGAIMSACGFSYVYLAILGFGAHALGYLPIEYMEKAFSLGYLILIGPVIGSGLAITAQAWSIAWRHRTATNFGVAAYDTFAQVYNMYGALRHVPSAWESVADLFSGGGSSSKSRDRDGKATLVLLVGLIVLLSLAGGILTTVGIIRSVAASHAADVRLRFEA